MSKRNDREEAMAQTARYRAMSDEDLALAGAEAALKITNIDAQLDAAELDVERYTNEWVRKAKTARRYVVLSQVFINAEKGYRKALKQKEVDRAFINSARQILEPDLFQKILEATQIGG